MLEEHKETLDDLLRERLVKQIEIATKKEELETIELKIVTMLARSSTTPLYVDWKGLTARHCRNAAGSGTNGEEPAFVRVGANHCTGDPAASGSHPRLLHRATEEKMPAPVFGSAQ